MTRNATKAASGGSAGAGKGGAAGKAGPKSEGQRLLLAVPASLSVVAAELGADQSAVSRWRSGLRAPGSSARLELLRAYGIPVASWSVRPGGSASTASTKSASTKGASTKVGISPRFAMTGSPAELERSAAARPVPRTLEAAVAHLIELDADARAEGLLPAEVAKIRAAKSVAIRLISDLEEREALREERIVESPAWGRIRRALVEALRPFPAAFKAAAGAMGAERGAR